MLFETADGRLVTNQDFSRRSTATELMDTEPTSFKEFDGYLRDLERINILTLAYRPTLLWLKLAVADLPAGRPISVLDVGSGGGMLRRLGKWETFRSRGCGTKPEPLTASRNCSLLTSFLPWLSPIIFKQPALPAFRSD